MHETSVSNETAAPLHAVVVHKGDRMDNIKNSIAKQFFGIMGRRGSDSDLVATDLETILFPDVVTLLEIGELLAAKIPQAVDFDVIIGIEEKGPGLALAVAMHSLHEGKSLKHCCVQMEAKEIPEMMRNIVKGKLVLFVCPVLSSNSFEKIRKMMQLFRNSTSAASVVGVISVVGLNVNVATLTNGTRYFEPLIRINF